MERWCDYVLWLVSGTFGMFGRALFAVSGLAAALFVISLGLGAAALAAAGLVAALTALRNRWRTCKQSRTVGSASNLQPGGWAVLVPTWWWPNTHRLQYIARAREDAERYFAAAPHGSVMAHLYEEGPP